jgi:hypothetical protein
MVGERCDFGYQSYSQIDSLGAVKRAVAKAKIVAWERVVAEARKEMGLDSCANLR